MTRRVSAAGDVLLQRLPDEEVVLLNLTTERYHGLNTVSARMWEALTATGRVDAAFQQLRGEFAVDDEQLRQDLVALVESLEQRGLLEVTD